MNAYLETAERAQAIRDRLNEDFRFRAAHDGFDNFAWTAEKSLAALLGEDVMIHAWIEQANTDRFEREGIIHVLTPNHLLTAEYGSGVHGTARIEPLDHAALSIQIRWPDKGDDGPGRPMYAVLTLSRPAGDLTIEIRNQRGDETRVERLLEGVQYLKTSMNGAPRGSPARPRDVAGAAVPLPPQPVLDAPVSTPHGWPAAYPCRLVVM